ncbi:hypothetical protein CALCODRAFT_495215 [Calocera cornea HHB12733]|uniref:Uncharacterized protein n=1 Tax=Calocera cornea HHB12733 TaxID=1353952 RepID=A0A165GJC2_9BASI|nr:hypothetical protein CALCODRAFT_495215 [Calocera cornea HHB12733]
MGAASTDLPYSEPWATQPPRVPTKPYSVPAPPFSPPPISQFPTFHTLTASAIPVLPLSPIQFVLLPRLLALWGCL